MPVGNAVLGVLMNGERAPRRAADNHDSSIGAHVRNRLKVAGPGRRPRWARYGVLECRR